MCIQRATERPKEIRPRRRSESHRSSARRQDLQNTRSCRPQGVWALPGSTVVCNKNPSPDNQNPWSEVWRLSRPKFLSKVCNFFTISFTGLQEEAKKQHPKAFREVKIIRGACSPLKAIDGDDTAVGRPRRTPAATAAYLEIPRLTIKITGLKCANSGPRSFSRKCAISLRFRSQGYRKGQKAAPKSVQRTTDHSRPIPGSVAL
jgi:hypothetical protein